jgi:flagellar protein FlgJ
LGGGGATTNVAESSANTGEQLEASILTHMYGEMMPDESAGIYGAGSAGQFWQQMFTEKAAEATAKRSPLRLAEQLGLADGQNVTGERRMPFFSKFEVKSYAG